MNKYEKLIEYIINEQEDKARELFHQIVVEKSREIYENLIDEEDVEEGVMDPVSDLVDEVEAEEEGVIEAEDEEGMDSDMEMDAEMPGDDMEEPGDDMDDMSGEEGEGELEDRVMDLEAALDELKAEFDALMSDEMNEPEHADMEMPADMEPPKESMVREYVDKVAAPNMKGEGGEVGHGGSVPVNKQSTVAGKNDMGGSSANIVKGGAEQAADGKPVPQPSNQYSKGKGNLPHAGSFENVPGAKTKGYAAKASAKSAEGSTTDGSMSVAKHSLVK
jgi:hypothetical protein